MKKILFGLVMFFVASTSVMAAGNKAPIYLGGGLSINDLSSFDDATGFQIFGGYGLGDLGAKGFDFAVEVGYMDSGDFEQKVSLGPFGTFTAETNATGLWATGVAAYAASPTVDLLGRLGLDFGDDDGLLFGVGVGFN